MGHFCQQNCKLWATSANKTPLQTMGHFCQQNSGPLLPLQTMGHFCQQNSSKKKNLGPLRPLCQQNLSGPPLLDRAIRIAQTSGLLNAAFSPEHLAILLVTGKKLNRFLGWQGGINKVRQLKAVKTRPCLVVGGWESKVESESLHPPTHHLRLEIKWPRTDISLAWPLGILYELQISHYQTSWTVIILRSYTWRRVSFASALTHAPFSFVKHGIGCLQTMGHFCQQNSQAYLKFYGPHLHSSKAPERLPY